MACPKCGSENVTFTREETASFGGTKYSMGGGHGIMYWIFIGWWLWPFKMLFHICTLGLFSRKKVKASSVNATKTINRTMAVCQGCGNTWKA